MTLKHFCCNNQEDNRNKTNVNVNERALREIYLKGFEIAVKVAGPGAVMSSYNKVNGKYVINSYRLLTQVLRNEWGFDGLVMTDWFATGRKYGNPAHAIASGNDLIMPGSSGTVDDIVKAVSKGIILEEDVKRSAANVLKGFISSRIYQGYLWKQRESVVYSVYSYTLYSLKLTSNDVRGEIWEFSVYLFASGEKQYFCSTVKL